MAVRKKKRQDGRFSTSVMVINPVTGEKQKKYVYGKTQKELREKAEAAKRILFSGDMTFEKFSDDWYRRNKINIKENTQRMYETAFNHLKVFYPMNMKDITTMDVQSFMAEMASIPNEANKVLGLLNQIFTDAVRIGIISVNPCTYVSKIKYRREETRVITQEEFKVVDNTVFTDREKMFLTLIRNYGLRKEEALALEKKHFDFTVKKLHIEQTFTYRNNQPKLSDTKTETSCRVLPLLDDDIPFFRHYLKVLQTDYLFTNVTSDTPISATSYKKMWESIQKKMDITAKKLNITIPGDATSKMFRHTFCTDLALAGVPVKVAQYLMGHKTASVTLNTYSHVSSRNVDSDMMNAFHNVRKTQK